MEGFKQGYVSPQREYVGTIPDGKNACLVVIDPQVDFCEGGALAVPGASRDMDIIASAIDSEFPVKFDRIVVTLDTHSRLHIANAEAYRIVAPPEAARLTSAEQRNLLTFAQLTVSENETIVKASKGDAKYVVEHRSIPRERVVSYLETLAKQNTPHTLWPTHCLVGTSGHAVHPTLGAALKRWERKTGRDVTYVMKGSDPEYENFSVFVSEIRSKHESLKSTHPFNSDLAMDLASYEKVYFAGEASTHCVYTSVRDYMDWFVNNKGSGGGTLLKSNAVVCVDAMSPIAFVVENEEKLFADKRLADRVELSSCHLTGKSAYVDKTPSRSFDEIKRGGIMRSWKNVVPGGYSPTRAPDSSALGFHSIDRFMEPIFNVKGEVVDVHEGWADVDWENISTFYNDLISSGSPKRRNLRGDELSDPFGRVAKRVKNLIIREKPVDEVRRMVEFRSMAEDFKKRVVEWMTPAARERMRSADVFKSIEVADLIKPRNPMGRTGYTGRGNLGKWGANRAADALVTRGDPTTKLEIALIQRKSGVWAIPGGMVDPWETPERAAIREFCEETLGHVFETPQKREMIPVVIDLIDEASSDSIHSELPEVIRRERRVRIRPPVHGERGRHLAHNATHEATLVFSKNHDDMWVVEVDTKDSSANPVHLTYVQIFAIKTMLDSTHEIYSGYVDDPRNTDNAWMETTAFHTHLQTRATGHKLDEIHLPISTDLTLMGGDDADDAGWFTIERGAGTWWLKCEKTAKKKTMNLEFEHTALFASHSSIFMRLLHAHEWDEAITASVFNKKNLVADTKNKTTGPELRASLTVYEPPVKPRKFTFFVREGPQSPGNTTLFLAEIETMLKPTTFLKVFPTEVYGKGNQKYRYDEIGLAKDDDKDNVFVWFKNVGNRDKIQFLHKFFTQQVTWRENGTMRHQPQFTVKSVKPMESGHDDDDDDTL